MLNLATVNSLLVRKQLVLRCAIFLLAIPTFGASAAFGLPQLKLPPEVVEQVQQLSLEEQLAIAEQYGVDLQELETHFTGQPKVASGAQQQGNDVVLLQQSADPNASEAEAEDPLEKQRPRTLKENIEVESVSIQPEKVDDLRRFGEEIFDQRVSNFAVTDNLPVSDNYLIGAADEIWVQLLGKEVSKHRLKVSRNGSIVFPRIGEIDVAGLTFSELKALVESSVSNAFIGTKAIITMGPLRKINVFAAGAVVAPGNYAVINSTTFTQLLFQAGGPSAMGSYRDIQVHRQGEKVASIDLYDLLLRGSLQEDYRLRNGDVLFVPLAGKTINIRGQVRRPAQFELLKGELLADALEMAGGLLPDALRTPSTLQRRELDDELPRLIDLKLSEPSALQIPVMNGDTLTVAKLPDKHENPIWVTGAVEHAGVFAWQPGLRVSHFFPSIQGRLTDSADLRTALIVRRRSDRQGIDVQSFSLEKAIIEAGSSVDPELRPFDEIIVFDLSKSRTELVKNTISLLEAQATVFERPRFVEVVGAVSDPGKLPLITGHRVSDLLKMAGGFAYLNLNVDRDIAVIVRRDTQSIDKYEAIPFELMAALKNRHSEADLVLEPMDELLILSEPDGETVSNRRDLLASVVERFERQATLDEHAQIVRIIGEVREPGWYPILNTLSVEHLIALAGGFTEAAYLNYGEIHRNKIVEGELQKTEILKLSLRQEDVQTHVLQSRDVLRVNRNPGWHEVKLASVSGEVRFPGDFVLRTGERLSELLERAGGVFPQGSLEGAVFSSARSRNNQQQRASQYIETLTRRNLSSNNPDDRQLESIDSLGDLVERELVGRVVIDLPSIVKGSPKVIDPIVQEGDSLHIPLESFYVSVVGEVFSPGDLSFQKNWKIVDYIEAAGGVTQFAEEKRAYVIKANGRVVKPLWKGVFKRRLGYEELEPGDTLVMPVNLNYSTGFERLGKISRVAFETLGSIAAILNIARL